MNCAKLGQISHFYTKMLILGWSASLTKPMCFHYYFFLHRRKTQFLYLLDNKLHLSNAFFGHGKENFGYEYIISVES